LQPCPRQHRFYPTARMERLNTLDKYFREKERKRLDAIRSELPGGLPEMTADEVRLSCLENNGYDCPELNDKLYLHFRGFKKIENLEKYTGCKAIWLDSNGFESIGGLDTLLELRCLYLSKNLIGEISGLENLSQLVTLDLSHNRLTKVSNLACCPLLETVNLSRNALATVESIAHFQECPNLKNIDLTMNRLENSEDFLASFAAIPALLTLSLNGNELCKIPSFRKRFIHGMPRLGYLDRPIEEVERLCATAFLSGGAEAEKAAREAHRDSINKKRTDEMALFRQWQQEQVEIRAKAKAEGRSLLPEPSEEEMERRREEAHRDAEEEKRILSLGVDKIANRYWQLEGNMTGDALAEAGRQLLAEQENASQQRPVVEVPSPDNDDDLHYNTSYVSPRSGAPAPLPSPPSSATEETKSFEPETLPPPPASSSSASTLPPPPPEAEEEVQVEKKDPQEEYLRQKRIADSMEIYKRQLAVAKAAGKKLTLGTGVGELLAECAATESTLNAGAPVVVAPAGRSVASSTWESAAAIKGELQAAGGTTKPYWSEEMDILLAKMVRANMFDFDVVAETLRVAAGPGGKLEKGAKKAGFSPELLTTDACRLRWTELDAEKWSAVAPTSTPMDTNFNVYVTSSMISSAQGHGGQPSYQALATLAAGSMPAYLTPPTAFPTVAEMDDGDMSDDEPCEVFKVPPPPIPVNFDAMD